MVFLVLEMPALGVQFQVKAEVPVHHFQRIIDSRGDMAHLAVRLRPGVDFEHLPERGV